MLRDGGFSVFEAGSAHAATAAVTARRFDVLLSDVNLGDARGGELLDALRLIDPDLPVVLMTERVDLDEAVAAVDGGALHYLLKPVERAVLLAAAVDGSRTREGTSILSPSRPLSGSGSCPSVLGR